MILLTRPAERCAALVGALAARGLASFAEPMLAIVPLPHAGTGALGEAQAVVFSSEYGPLALAAGSAALPAYAVGARTAAAARAQGWRVVGTADTGAALAPLLPSRTLHVRGAEAATALGDLPPLIVYEARPAAPALSSGCVKHLKNGDFSHALFFSARTGGRFVRLAEAAGVVSDLARIRALCLSPRVVESISPALWAGARAPARPRMEEILDLL